MTTKKNTGKKYEIIVEDAFKILMSIGQLKTVKLKRNEIIMGKSGTNHEIDIYWEYLLGKDPTPKKVIFQAKDWVSRVSQSCLLTFKSVIDDIPGCPQGIFVTKTGYQKGAFTFAKNHGIPIWELREPQEDDWKGKIRSIHFTYHISHPNIKQDFVWDNDWNKRKYNIENLCHTMSFRKDRLYFYNNKRDITGQNFHDLSNYYLMQCYENRLNEYEVEHIFPEETFIATGHEVFQYAKLNSIKFYISINTETITDVIDGLDIVKYLLFEILSNKSFTINKDNTIKEH